MFTERELEYLEGVLNEENIIGKIERITMWHRIELGENCNIIFSTDPKFLRRYDFKYIMFHGIKQERSYDIYLVRIDNKDYFKATNFMDDSKYFDTYKDATDYISDKFNELYNDISREEDEIRAYIETNNKRKKGVKVS